LERRRRGGQIALACRVRTFTFFLVLGLTTLQAQSFRHVKISAGARIGAPLDDPSNNQSIYSTFTQGRWTGGPTVELHLPKHFSVEFDALFRNYRTTGSQPLRFDRTVNAYLLSSQQRTNVWDLPLLLKYRIPMKTFKPFVNAGFQWSHQSFEGGFAYECLGTEGSCVPRDPPFPAPPGFEPFNGSNVKRSLVAGVGVDFKTRYLTISPEVRFNRPSNDYPRDVRVTALVGFTFGKK
jgi:hypothetical protein